MIIKNLNRVIISMFIFICLHFSVVGCSPKVVDIVVKNDTYQSVIVKNTQFDVQNINAIIKYSDDSVKIVSADELVFGDIDTTTTGIKELSVSYDGYTVILFIKVVESDADITTISMFESGVVKDFNSNISNENSVDKPYNFFNSSNIYTIGDDNPFNFRINAKGIDLNDNLISDVKKFRISAKLESVKQINDTLEYSNLSDEEINKIVEIDTINHTFDFSENAINNLYRITVSAVNFDSNYFDEAPSFSIVTRIVDGYNVFNATDLSILDNSNSVGWQNLKTEQQLALSNSINGVVLHNNIEIFDSDIPSDLFYTETEASAIGSGVTTEKIVGSMKDNSKLQVYHRILKENQTFNFEGNYYQINFSKLSKIVVETGSENGIKINSNGEESITAHTCLIRVTPNNTYNNYPNFNMNNVSFLGNGARSNKAINSGGIILLKAKGINFYSNNNIYQDTFIGFFFENYGDSSEVDKSYFEINKTKGYNCYSSLLYMYGAKNVKIIDSELIGAGGPVMIVDHYNNDDKLGTGGFPSNVDVINSNLESFVSGLEPWFATYGATALIPSIKAANAVYFSVPEEIRPTFLVNTNGQSDMINMICVMKSSSAEGLTTSRIKGKVTLFDSLSDYEKQQEDGDYSYGLNFYSDLSDKAMASLVGAVNGTDGSGNPTIDMSKTSNYFQSNKTGGYVSTSGDSSGEFYNGDYVNIYLFNGMGTIFQLFPVK